MQVGAECLVRVSRLLNERAEFCLMVVIKRERKGRTRFQPRLLQ